MIAAEVRESLLRRWPTSEYLSIEEAPQSSDRQTGVIVADLVGAAPDDIAAQADK